MALVQGISGSFFVNFAALGFALYIVACIRSYVRLRNIPGPRLHAWSVFPLFRVHFKGKILDAFFDLTQRYGPLVRIAPNTILVSDPDVLRRMSERKSRYTRDEFYLAARLVPGEDNLFSTVDEEAHTILRKKMAAAYAGKENSMLEQDIDDCVRDLITLIDTKYVSTPPDKVIQMDLARKMQYFTTDVISKLAMDSKFHDLRDDKDNYGYIGEFETVAPNIVCTTTVPRFLQFLTDIGFIQLFAPSWNKPGELGLGRVLAVTRTQVQKRFDEEGNPKEEDHDDMLGSFIRHGLTQREVEREALLQMGAGSDTTASGLRATLLCIFSHPRVHAKLLSEVQAAVSVGNFGTGTDNIISDEQARELPYLQACIKEGLRWFPPIAAMLSKKVPPEGDEICGYFVPGGTAVAYSTKAVHRSPALFGPDEEAFRPERWILSSEGGDEPSADKIKAMEDNNELIFGYGKYQCLGRSVAFVELNKVIFELVRRFQMDLVNTMRPLVTSCYAVHLQREMWVTVRGNGGNGDSSAVAE